MMKIICDAKLEFAKCDIIICHLENKWIPCQGKKN